MANRDLKLAYLLIHRKDVIRPGLKIFDCGYSKVCPRTACMSHLHLLTLKARLVGDMTHTVGKTLLVYELGVLFCESA